MALFGLDFGTANVRTLAAQRAAQSNTSDVVSVPAVASFERGNISVGEPVLMMAAVVPDVVVVGPKRLLGRPPTDALVRRLAERGGYRVARHGSDDLGLLHADDEAVGASLVGICAELLRYAVDSCGLKQPPHDLFIAVPSWFGEPQREALLRAAAHARLRVRRFVPCGVAAALWAAQEQKLRGRVAVVDVGAGGIDVAIVHIQPSELRLLGSHGSAMRGGDDVDGELLATAVADPDRRTAELVRQACESLKRELSTTESASREVRGVQGDAPLVISAERWELGFLVGALETELEEVISKALADAAVETEDVEAVLAVGGMASLASIRAKIGSCFGRAAPEASGSHSVAQGTALLASGLEGQALDLRVSDGERPIKAVELPPPAPEPRDEVKRRAPRVKVTTRRKEVARHRPDVTRRRVEPKRGRASLDNAPGGEHISDATPASGPPPASSPAAASSPPPASTPAAASSPPPAPSSSPPSSPPSYPTSTPPPP